MISKIQELYFKDINFVYDSIPVYANNITVKFQRGNINIITGENGCGKSTLMNLALYIWDNYEGNIYIDNRDISEFDKEVLRAHIGFSFQDPAIFNDSLINNITLGVRVEESCMYAVLDVLHFLNDINAMEQKMNQVVDNKSLSQGQKQKVSICRLLYSKKPIMIFDEPTSNLDMISTDAFINYLQRIKKEFLVIVISHDIRLIQVADYNYSMDIG